MIRVWNEIRYVEVPNGDIMDEPTNMFIVGRDPVLLIDPGSAVGVPKVVEALELLGNPEVTAILLTHVHVDHGAGADEIRRITGAPVRFHEFERAELDATTSHDITLDQPIVNGEIIEHAGFQFEAVLTPGHAAGHLSFIETRENFGLVGDLITGSGSSAVFPPWGDLAAYIESMRLIAERGTNPLLPSHGEPVTNGPDALRRFIQRRIDRDEQILSILAENPLPVDQIRDQLYGELPQDLLSDVTGNVILHLEKLEREGRVRREATGESDTFVLASRATSKMRSEPT